MAPSLSPPAASRAELQLLASLQRRRDRREQGLLLVEGRTLLVEALAADLAPPLVAATESAARDAADVLDAARAAGARLVRLADHQVARVSDTEHGTGLVAAVPRPTPWDARWSAEGPVLVAVLWGLQDPGNVGMLLRSARAFGAAGCLLAPGSADATGPKAVRASAGAALHLPCGTVDDADALATLARDGDAEVVAAVAPARDNPTGDAALPARCLLVLGHETHGLPEACRGRTVSLPQEAAVESLNVGVAGAVLMADWYRAQVG